MVGQADDKNDSDNHDDEFFAVNKFPSESIAQEAEGKLTNDVADIGGRIDRTTEKQRVGWGFLVIRTWEAAPISEGFVNTAHITRE